MKIVLAFFGAFTVFFSAGYGVASYFMSTPTYLSIYIASNTVVKLNDGDLKMIFLDGDGSPFWTYKLLSNKAKFEEVGILSDSIRDAEISATSPLLIELISGGSGVTMLATTRSVLLRTTSKEPSTFWVRIATAVGMITGGVAGYWVKSSLVGPDMKDVRNFIKKPENIEVVKKRVYSSMLSNYHPNSHEELVNLEKNALIDDKGNGLGCLKGDRVKCIENATSKTRTDDFISKTELILQAEEKLAVDGANLEGYEFVVFFIK